MRQQANRSPQILRPDNLPLANIDFRHAALGADAL